jgi:hypothetical protein
LDVLYFVAERDDPSPRRHLLALSAVTRFPVELCRSLLKPDVFADYKIIYINVAFGSFSERLLHVVETGRFPILQITLTGAGTRAGITRMT